jgi:hypothetical protein
VTLAGKSAEALRGHARAGDHLLVTGVNPASEFLQDLVR